MRIMLLVTAFNGLSQRAWCALREAGHEAGVLLATGERDMIDGVRAADPELIICPFLKDRVPAEVWQNWRTALVVVQPDTVVRWHRDWLRRRWTQRSRPRPDGRPSIDQQIRALVREMATANPL